jgi:hypothetical protein
MSDATEVYLYKSRLFARVAHCHDQLGRNLDGMERVDSILSVQ